MSEPIKKYTKRPVTVEAVQFTDTTKDAVWRWACDIRMNVYPGRDDNGSPCLRIPTKEGEMTCSLGDWLIREPFPTTDRKLYPCKPDIFEQTYQPAPEPSEQNEKLSSDEIWTAIEYKVNWKIYEYLILYLLHHDNGSYSIGYPYEVTDGIGYPKMSVTHYAKLPDGPKQFQHNYNYFGKPKK